MQLIQTTIKITKRLQYHEHPHVYKHVIYERAGHAFGVPGLPTSESTEVPFFPRKNLLLGGNPKENAAAQFDAWHQVKEFLKTNF